MLNSENKATSVRCLTLITAASLALAGALWWLWPDLTAAPDLGSLEHLLAQACSLVAALCLTWGWAVTTATSLSVTLGRGSARPAGHYVVGPRWGCPESMQRLILMICGVSLMAVPLVGTGVAAQALDRSIDPGGPSIVRGLPLPDRPASPTGSARTPGLPQADRSPPPTGSIAHGHRARPRVVVVRPGDSLWAIAEARLPPDAGDITIDQAWRRIYDLNRTGIGADPDLILPGQPLAIPPQETDS